MSDYVTHEELSELMQGLLSGISDMFTAQEKKMDEKLERMEQRMDERFNRMEERFDHKLERMENQIMMRIENGIGVQAQAQGEKLDALTDHVISLTEDIQEIKSTLQQHDDEIITLKRIK